jgi:N6-L-threonylcarbamoyladenine synthase
MIILGIETSCDETAAAVVEGDAAARPPLGRPGGRVRAQAMLSQIREHQPFGGIVPEIAARAHLTHLDSLIVKTMADAGVTYADLDAVAATGGPGLIGGVIVGVMTAKALALSARKPFIAVNHLEAHALTARLTDGVAFPFLLLLVSGGHCQLLVVEGVGRYRRLGTTVDDAAGEAFDKVAKMLGLGYPGGPAIERAAAKGDATRFDFPRPMKGRPGCDFSFSGLKTAVRLAVEALAELSGQDVADIAAAFQAALVESIIDRVRRAAKMFTQSTDGRTLVVSGGVAANTALRAALRKIADNAGLKFVAPPLSLCTDNGVMIAWAGLERLQLGLQDGLNFAPRPRWPLDPTAPARPGAGVKA